MTSSDAGVREWTDEDGHLSILSYLCICMCLYDHMCKCIFMYVGIFVYLLFYVYLQVHNIPQYRAHAEGELAFLSCKLSFRLGELPDGLPFLQVIPLQKN